MNAREDPARTSREPGRSPLQALFSTRGELAGAITCGVLLATGFVLNRFAGLEAGKAVVWAALAVGSLYGGRAAAQSLLERRFDIDVLMIIGAWLSAYLGHPEEGALLLFLFTLAGALEDLAMQRTRREVEALHKLMPTEAIVFRDGEWRAEPPEKLAPGNRIKIRPGDRVPTDAEVVSGESSFDQSAITGESMPRPVKPGDQLYAGTINTDDPIEARVLRPVSESSLQKILSLVTQARELREPVQRTIDRLSQPYAIGVMVMSTAVLLVWWLVLARPFENAVYTAITLLIVASPCALVIATPTATLATIARAARAGVLFKGGQSIDRLANITSVCFDKTGTLTFGRPRLYEVHPVAWSDGRELLAMAAALEAESTHPIAAAVREAARERGIEPAEVTDHDHTAGRGVGGRYHGCPVRLGSYRHTEELIPVCFRNRVQEVLTRIQDRGHLGVVVAHACPQHAGGGEAAVLIMADAVRPGAKPLVSELHQLGIKPVRMLTGDNRITAERVAGLLGLDRFDAELLPADKVDAVRAMKDEAAAGGRSGIAVIGDGVNDAPALAAADVAIAIGSIGSDAALETADIVLLSDDLAVVPWAVRLARSGRRKVKHNLVFALSVIIIMAIATLAGSLLHRPVPLSVGVLAHEGGTLLVVFNSLLLLGIPGVHAGRREAATAPARAGTGVVTQPTA